MAGTRFRLPGPYTMSNAEDQEVIDRLIRDISRMYETVSAAPGSTNIAPLIADTTNQKIYAREGDEYIEVGNV